MIQYGRRWCRGGLKFYYNIDNTLPRSLKSNQSYFVEVDPVTHGFKTAFSGTDSVGIDVEVRSGRNLGFTVDGNGFQLSPCNFGEVDFTQDMEILRNYYPQVAEYVKQTLGAYKVFSYAHVVRRSTVGKYVVEGDVRVGGATQ